VRSIIILLALLAIATLLAGNRFVAARNEISTQKEEIDRAWADLNAVLDRRTDLVPKLIDLVKGHLKAQPDVRDAVETARSAMRNAQTPAQRIDAYYMMNVAFDKLLNAIADDSSLKASEKFKSLAYQFNDAENSILEARQRYNEAIKKYNTTLSLFPNNVVARLSGYTRDDAYFKTEVNARTAPKWTF
jgi:LemA protein